MDAIFIILIFSIVLTFISLYKKDSSLIMFSGIFLVFTGIIIMSTGFGDLLRKYAIWFGFIIVFLGIYVFIRTGVELMFKKEIE